MSLLAALTLAVATVHGQTPSVDDILKGFVPREALELEPGEDVETCARVLETNQGQPTVIVAAYTRWGGGDGRLRLLVRGADGEYGEIPEARWILDGASYGCEMELRDFDADGRPEIYVVGESERSWAGWLFAWPGRSERGEALPFTLIGSPIFQPEEIDLRHDGTSPLFVPHGDFDPDVDRVRVGRAYQPGNPRGNSAEDYGDVWFACYAGCTSGAATLRKPDGTGTYVLRLVNGVRGGANRVRVTDVTVNGRDRLPRRLRGSDAEFIEVPLGRGLKAGAAVAVRAIQMGPDGQLLAVLIRRP